MFRRSGRMRLGRPSSRGTCLTDQCNVLSAIKLGFQKKKVVSRQTPCTVRHIMKDFACKPTIGDWSIVTVDCYIINWIEDDMVSRLAPVGEKLSLPSPRRNCTTHRHLNAQPKSVSSTSIYTRVGTLIVATIYLQLIQNRYMFRSLLSFNVVTSIVHNPLPAMWKS